MTMQRRYYGTWLGVLSAIAVCTVWGLHARSSDHGSTVGHAAETATSREGGESHSGWSETAHGEAPDVLKMRPLAKWTTFTHADGLPSDKVLVIRVDGNRVWA